MKVFHIESDGALEGFCLGFFFLEVMVCFYFCFSVRFEMGSFSVALKLMMVLSHPKP